LFYSEQKDFLHGKTFNPLKKGDNAYLPSIIETLITNPDNGVFGFLP
jgi:hypothetical protein